MIENCSKPDKFQYHHVSEFCFCKSEIIFCSTVSFNFGSLSLTSVITTLLFLQVGFKWQWQVSREALFSIFYLPLKRPLSSKCKLSKSLSAVSVLRTDTVGTFLSLILKTTMTRRLLMLLMSQCVLIIGFSK